MVTEYETKVLDINVKKIIEKLETLGAKKVLDCTYKRHVFDLADGGWIRIRNDGQTTTLTYKKRNGKNIGDTTEIETIVNDFEATIEIINKIPHTKKYYRENKRIMYKLDNLEFCIDTLPKIPTFLEIESDSIENVKKGLKILNLENKDIGDVSMKELYDKYNQTID